MKDTRRIERLLAKIRIIWLSNPDLSLCQLIGNCFEQLDLGAEWREDDELEESLNKTYGLKVMK